MRKQTIQYTTPLDALVAITKRLGLKEGKYNIESEDFYYRYQMGENGRRRPYHGVGERLSGLLEPSTRDRGSTSGCCMRRSPIIWCKLSDWFSNSRTYTLTTTSTRC